MTMDRMVKYLENRGFMAEKKYDSASAVYKFTITKDGHCAIGYFKYPETKDPNVKDKLQEQFLRELIDEFGKVHTIEDYCVQDIELTEQLYRTMINSHYGMNPPYIPAIKDVIFNPPATIVFWIDGTKTVVKVDEYDSFDPEKGLAMAISKKALGNQGNYYNVFKKWVNSYYVKEAEAIGVNTDMENMVSDFQRSCMAFKEAIFDAFNMKKGE